VTHGRKWFSENVGYREARCIFGKKKEKKRHTDYFPVKQLLLKLFQTGYRECREYRVIYMNRIFFYFISKKLIIVFCVA
jgi:hypothetical protein